MLHTDVQLKISFGYGEVVIRMRAPFPKKFIIKAIWPKSVVIFINNATFFKSAYVGKIIYGLCMSIQPNKWLVPDMVGMVGVVVKI